MSFFASYFLYCVHEYMMTQHSYQTELELSMRVTYNTNEIQVRRLCVCVCVYKNDPLRARPDSV